MTNGPDLLRWQIEQVYPVTLVACEYKFHSKRKWRFDLAIPPCWLAVEVDGGAWTGGRHTRGKGYVADMEKLNEAVLLGWRVLRVTPRQVKSGEALKLVERALKTA